MKAFKVVCFNAVVILSRSHCDAQSLCRAKYAPLGSFQGCHRNSHGIARNFRKYLNLLGSWKFLIVSSVAIFAINLQKCLSFLRILILRCRVKKFCLGVPDPKKFIRHCLTVMKTRNSFEFSQLKEACGAVSNLVLSATRFKASESANPFPNQLVSYSIVFSTRCSRSSSTVM